MALRGIGRGARVQSDPEPRRPGQETLEKLIPGASDSSKGVCGAIAAQSLVSTDVPTTTTTTTKSVSTIADTTSTTNTAADTTNTAADTTNTAADTTTSASSTEATAQSSEPSNTCVSTLDPKASDTTTSAGPTSAGTTTSAGPTFDTTTSAGPTFDTTTSAGPTFDTTTSASSTEATAQSSEPNTTCAPTLNPKANPFTPKQPPMQPPMQPPKQPLNVKAAEFVPRNLTGAGAAPGGIGTNGGGVVPGGISTNGGGVVPGGVAPGGVGNNGDVWPSLPQEFQTGAEGGDLWAEQQGYNVYQFQLGSNGTQSNSNADTTPHEATTLELVMEMLWSASAFPGSYDSCYEKVQEAVHHHAGQEVGSSESIYSKVFEMLIGYAMDNPELGVTAIKMCVALVENKTDVRTIFLKRLQADGERVFKTPASDEEVFCLTNFVFLLAEAFVRLKILNEPISALCIVMHEFISMMLEANSDELLVVVCKVLKLSGSLLEKCDKEKMDSTVSKLNSIKSQNSHCADWIKQVIALRESDWGVSSSSSSSSTTDFGFPVEVLY